MVRQIQSTNYENNQDCWKWSSSLDVSIETFEQISKVASFSLLELLWKIQKWILLSALWFLVSRSAEFVRIDLVDCSSTNFANLVFTIGRPGIGQTRFINFSSTCFRSYPLEDSVKKSLPKAYFIIKINACFRSFRERIFEWWRRVNQESLIQLCAERRHWESLTSRLVARMTASSGEKDEKSRRLWWKGRSVQHESVFLQKSCIVPITDADD